MSESSDKQNKECEEIKEQIEKEIEEVCPSCIPDPYAPKIDWINEEEPYFDPRTCEYIANVSFHKTYDIFQNGIEFFSIANENTFGETGLRTKKIYDDLRTYAEDQKARGTEILLKYFGKKITKENLSLSFIPEDGVFVSPNSVVNIKIVIVAERLNALGELTQQDLEEQEQPENNTVFPDTLTIDDSEFELWEKLITTNLGILAYEGKYSYFRTIEDGIIKYDKEGELIFFKPKDIRDSLDDFKKQLDKLLTINGMSFYNVSSFFGVYDTVTKIEIEFDNSDENKPFKIHKVYATSGNCPRKELFKGLSTFKEKAYLPTAIFYMLNFEKAYEDLTAPEPRDWIEFFEEYTYPPVQVVYGTSGEETKITESGLACALDIDLGKLASGLLEDFFHSAWDVFSNSFDLLSCSDEPIDREPALKQFIRPDEQESYEKFYKEELKRLRKERQDELNAFASSDFRNISSTDKLKQKEEELKKEKKELEAELEKEASQKAEEKVNKMNKKNFAHPFYEHFKQSLKQRFDNDQNILAVFNKIQKDTKLTESAKIQKFIQSVGMCGISNGFKKALGCLMKQVDIKSLITASVRVFFKGFKIQDLSNALRDLLIGLPPEKQIEVQLKVEEKLGSVKPPWETLTTNPDQKVIEEEQNRTKGILKGPDGKPLTEEINGKQVPITQAALGERTNRNVAENDGSSQFSRGINNSVNQSIKLVLETYMEEILGAATPDDLIKKYKKEIPAIAEILKSSEGDCKTAPVKDIKDSKLADYKFDVCNPTLPTIDFKIPEISWKPNVWKSLKRSIKKAIREAILTAISALVSKLINLLEQKLCDALSAIGKAGLDSLPAGDVDFSKILRNSFCPDASDEEVKDLGNSLLNKIGAKDTDIQNAFDCFTGAIFGSMTQREMIDLITLKQKNPVDIKMFMQTIKVGCPNMYDLVNTPNKAENFFNNIGNLIPQDTRDLLQSSVPYSSDGVPFYNSICLTSEELRIWDQLRRQGLENAGLNSQDAADQVDLYNQRARDALTDVLDAINNGPNADLNDMIQDLFSPLTDDPCDKKRLNEAESLFGNKVAKEPEELVNIQNDLSNRIFDNILDQVKRDFTNSFGFDGSFLERILTDTEGVNYGLHRLYESWIFSRNHYHDSETAKMLKADRNLFGFDPGEDRGYFPETVGLYCKTKLLENQIQYNSNVQIVPGYSKFITNFPIAGQEITLDLKKEPIENSSFDLLYEKETKGLNFKNKYGKISFISGDLFSQQRNLNYKIITSNNFKESISYNTISTKDLEDLTIENDLSKEYRYLVFNSYVNKKLEVLNTSIDITDVANFKSSIQTIFSEIMKLIVEESNGFEFGFEDEDLKPEDLEYVDPQEGSDSYTYENEDKILGRSKTNHPRVTFLNPENYGGSYKIPPVHIRPKEMNGWMKFSKVLFPEEQECEPKSQNIINHNKIKAFVNSRRNSATLQNEEMVEMSNACYFDKPFKKLLTKNASSSIEGLIKTQIRASIVKEVIKGLPIVSCLKYTTENYDTTAAQTILENLVMELKSVNPFGNIKLEKQNYYLIFLEQAVQYFISSTVSKLPKKNDPNTGEEIEEKDFSELGVELENAYNKIKSFIDNFTYENIKVPENGTINLLGTDEFDSSFLRSNDYNSLAGVYQKIGDYIFQSTSEFEYKKDFLQNESTTNLYSVLFAIRLCEKEAQTILNYLIRKEYEELMKDLYVKQKPVIDDIYKALLTNKNLFENNSISDFGFNSYEQKIAIGSYQNIGSPNDVVDNNVEEVFEDSSAFKMKIEKYIRIKEKEELPNELREIFSERDHNLKSVVSIEKLQTFFDDNLETFGDYKISDLFSENGFKMGMRIVMNLPSISILDRQITFGDIEKSKLEKCYFMNLQNLSRQEAKISIPIVAAEVDIMDIKIKDLNLNNIYDTDCLARKLVKEKDFKVFFKQIIPLQAASSLALQYVNSFFIESIGIDDGWKVENPEEIKEPEFQGTNLKIRKYFACFYNSNHPVHSENFRLPKLEFPDFWKLLFGGFSSPEINLNLILETGIKFEHKIINIDPFNDNGEKCNE